MTYSHTTKSKHYCTIKMYNSVLIFCGGGIMKGEPITMVEPLENGILKVTFDTGNCVTIDMKPRFSSFRFGALENPRIWETVNTDGIFILWYKNGMTIAELAYNEVMKMILGESY